MCSVFLGGAPMTTFPLPMFLCWFKNLGPHLYLPAIELYTLHSMVSMVIVMPRDPLRTYDILNIIIYLSNINNGMSIF